MSMGIANLYLDSRNSMWLGVCAGIAKWLDIPAAIVRIVFILCVLAWPPFLLGYFILWFCLDKDFTPEKVRDYFSNTPTAEHFRKLNYRKPIYKNERDKKIAGVCAGIAEYLEVSAFSVRIVTLLSLFVFGPFTFWAYIICWIVFDPDPHMSDQDRYERIMRRRERRAERRRARHARRQARKVRKSYRNGEFDTDIDDIENAVNNTMDEVNIELRAELGNTFSGFRSKARTRKAAEEEPRVSRKECVELYSSLETRLREIEAFMTSKKFRLHCEINRI
jgi:phage shock protein C